MKYSELSNNVEIAEAFNVPYVKVFVKPIESETYEVANKSIINISSVCSERKVIAVVGSSDYKFTPTLLDRKIPFDELKKGEPVKSFSLKYSGPMGVKISSVSLEEEGKQETLSFSGQEFKKRSMASFLSCIEEIELKDVACENINADNVSRVLVELNTNPSSLVTPQVIINGEQSKDEMEFVERDEDLTEELQKDL